MESQVHFPPYCEVVGQVPIFETECTREDFFYFKGRHPELRSWGPVKFVDGDTGPETRVRVLQGPSEYFLG